jgi:fructokinase
LNAAAVDAKGIEGGASLKQEPRILVCGEALMDVFPGATTPDGLSLEARVGGSPFNVALGLARMAQPVAFMGCISRDPFGERLLAALAEENVDVRAVQRTSAATTLSIVGVARHGAPAYAFHGAKGADRQLGPRVLDLIPRSLRALHVGSYAMVVEPIAATLRALVDRWHTEIIVAWDPNVRLSVEPNADCWRSQLAWMLPRTHLLKLSEEDLELLAPGAAHEEFAMQALSCGVRLVVITHGSRGASAWWSTGHVDVPAKSVVVADSVGAGDAFQAALLSWFAEKDRLTQDGVAFTDSSAALAALEFATWAAAITCTRHGAVLPRRDELREQFG